MYSQKQNNMKQEKNNFWFAFTLGAAFGMLLVKLLMIIFPLPQ